MTPTQHLGAVRALLDVLAERHRQHRQWGEQNWPDGTDESGDVEAAAIAREVCDKATRAGRLTYRNILEEEFSEALAESDPAALRAELVQVAAVAVAWVEKLDREAAKQAAGEAA